MYEKEDEKELVEKITMEVLEKLQGQSSAEKPGKPGNSTPPSAVEGITPAEIAKYIDHTLLKPEATEEQINTICDEAMEYGFHSVCVNTGWAEHCAKRLRGSDVKLCVVVGFPLGATSSRIKAFETRHAIEDGAAEIDMVINIGALKSGKVKLVEEDIRQVLRACRQNTVLKVIIETALLSDEEKVLACEIVKKSGAHYVKTSTGFASGGANIRDVALMRRTIGPGMGVKAAGGVKSFADAVAMIKAGATRIGTSGGVNIVKGEDVTTGY